MGLLQSFPSGIGYAILAMLVACLLPYVFALFAKISGKFDFKTDNANPRAFFAKATGRSARLNAAQANSFESLPMFLAAVLVAMYCFVPQPVVNAIAWLYVLLRVIYGLAYAFDMPTFRSLIWSLSLMCCVLLFYFAIRLV